MRSEGLPEVAIRSFRHYFEALEAGETGLLAESEIEPVAEVPRAADLGAFREAGREALARTAVVKLNGGLGTSMGMTRAKSLLPAKGGESFLSLIARQVAQLERDHGSAVPLVLMNSYRTRADSLAVLGEGPGPRGIPVDFLQHKVPRIDAATHSPARWPGNPEHEWCPPGHGDIYPALLSSGMLTRLLEAGVHYAFVSNSDNLGAALDLPILGWFAAEGAPFAMEVCDRTPADRKGGHLARLADGRLTLREIAQCPKAELDRFQDIERFRYFNTNNLWLDLRALSEALARCDGVLGLPMIRNQKPIDPQDPSSPPVIQLETAMGAAIASFAGARALQVPRSRFAPVKTTGDLLAIWSDAYRLGEDFRIGPARETPVAVDLDPAYFRTVPDLEKRFPAGPPSLVDCTRLCVRGDVRFGAGVVCRGSVTVESDVADGSVLGA